MKTNEDRELRSASIRLAAQLALVIVALVSAAAYVYEIKFESTLQAERLAKLRGEIRRERRST